MERIITLMFCIAPLFSFGQMPNYLPSNGLVAWYPFNGNSNDESVNSNDGVVNGASLATDRYAVSGSAYLFDGIDDYIYVGNLEGISTTSSHTMSVWVNKDSDGCSNEMVLATKDNPPADNLNLHYGFKPCDTDCETSMCMGMDFYANSLVSNDELDTSWVCWTLTYDSVSLERSIYLNGSLVEQATASAAYNGNLDFMIGATQWQGFPIGAYFNGKLDDIAVWNRVLNPNELEGLCNTGSPVGINESTKSHFQIYPNPTHSSFMVILPSNGKIELFDSSGRVIRFYSNTSTQEIDLKGYKGLVFVKATLSNKVVVKKVVLQ